MASTIRGSDNFDTVGSSNTSTRLAKAWVNFNGTGNVAIRSSYNISSITDNGTGDYTANFTTNMPNTNYCTVTHASHTNQSAGNGLFSWEVTENEKLVGSVGGFVIRSYNNTVFDMYGVGLTVFSS